jgi:effector-binding domain-containing protein
MEPVTSIAPQLHTGCAQPYVAIAISLTQNSADRLNNVAEELTGWLNLKGVKIAGPLFNRYRTLSNSTTPLNIEVGYPVATQVQSEGKIAVGIIPKGTYATLVHCGQADTINNTFETMQYWALQRGIRWKYDSYNGNQVWAGRFEFHLTDPANIPDISQCRTAIAVLIDEETSG